MIQYLNYGDLGGGCFFLFSLARQTMIDHLTAFWWHTWSTIKRIRNIRSKKLTSTSSDWKNSKWRWVDTETVQWVESERPVHIGLCRRDQDRLCVVFNRESSTRIRCFMGSAPLRKSSTSISTCWRFLIPVTRVENRRTVYRAPPG